MELILNEEDNHDVYPTKGSLCVLSSASVYASLQSYNDQQQHSSSDTQSSSNVTTSRERTPKKLQDSALVTFYATVSNAFHRTAPRLDGKNTAGRPLSTTDITSRLSQRALSFAGRGYYSSNSTLSKRESVRNRRARKKKVRKTSVEKILGVDDSVVNTGASTAATASFNISMSQRKRKRQALAHRMNCSHMNDEVYDVFLQQQNAHFLQRLNCEWNVYIRNLLVLQHDADTSVKNNYKAGDDDDKLVQRIQDRIYHLQENRIIEWVGAYVRIQHPEKGNEAVNNTDPKRFTEESGTKPNKKRRKLAELYTEGILVSHNPNDWILAPIDCNSQDERVDAPTTIQEDTTITTNNTNDHASERESVVKDKHVQFGKYHWHPCTMVKIPKRDVSVISVIIPITSHVTLIDFTNITGTEEACNDVQFINILLPRSAI
jgi:hypothetical protein